VRLGFRGEFTNGWNEAHGRASNYTFVNGVIQTQPVVGGSRPRPIMRRSFRRAHWNCVVAFRTEENRGSGRLRLCTNALIDNLSYRLDQNPPYNTVFAAKGVTGHNLTFANISPTSITRRSGSNNSVVPSGVDPNVKTRGGNLFAEDRAGNCAEHNLERGLHRLARLSRIASVDQNLPSAAYPYPTQVVTPTSTGLANPALWNTTNWSRRASASTTGLRWM